MDKKKINLKQARNLFKGPTRNEHSVVHIADRITRMQVNKAKKLNYSKDNEFLQVSISNYNSEKTYIFPQLSRVSRLPLNSCC